MRMIKTFEEFFIPHDLHQQRTFESWELPIIFMEAVHDHEAEILIASMSTPIMSAGAPKVQYQRLAQAL